MKAQIAFRHKAWLQQGLTIKSAEGSYPSPMTMLSSAPSADALRSPADLVVADRRIAGLSWSAYRSVLDTLIARAALERDPRRPGDTDDSRPREQRVVR